MPRLFPFFKSRPVYQLYGILMFTRILVTNQVNFSDRGFSDDWRLKLFDIGTFFWITYFGDYFWMDGIFVFWFGANTWHGGGTSVDAPELGPLCLFSSTNNSPTRDPGLEPRPWPRVHDSPRAINRRVALELGFEVVQITSLKYLR